MRKTKVVMITSYFDRNGVTSQVMNYATNLNKNKFQVSIAAGEPYDIGYEKLCQENNIELCKLPRKQKNVYAYYRTVYSFLKKKETRYCSRTWQQCINYRRTISRYVSRSACSGFS